MSQQPAASALHTNSNASDLTTQHLAVWLISAYAILGGCVTLLGWAVDQRPLTDWANDGISMFVNTAVCTILSGIAVVLVLDRGSRWRVLAARIAAVLVALVGGLTLLENLFAVDLGIDTLLWSRDWGQRAAAAPMRMGPPAATSFLILGSALILTTLSSHARRNASALAFLPITISLLSLIGYWFGADQLFGIARLTGIARQTSTLIAALGIAVIAVVPEYGIMAALRRSDTGGAVLRRLIVPIICIPVLLGWLHIAGQHLKLYDPAFGAALRTVIEVVLLFALLWGSSRSISRHATAAREARERLVAIIESTQDAVLSKSLNGTIASWNAGAAQLFGYSESEAVGQNIMMLFPPENVREETEILRKVRTGERMEPFETEGLRKDGTIVNVSVTVSPLRDAGGNVIGASMIARDITERKRADEAIRQSEAELKSLADTIPQLAWMANRSGDVFWYNQRWYEYTGTTFDQMEGWGWQSVHDPQTLPAVLERWKHSVATGQPFEMEFPIRGADGEFRWFLTRVMPVRDEKNRVLRWFGTNTDIDRAKRDAQALRDKSHMLELLNKTGTIVGAKLELEDLLHAVTNIAKQLSDAEFAAFFYNTTDEHGDAYLLYSLAGAPREAFEQLGRPRMTPLFAPTFRGESSIRSDDILKDPRYGQMDPHRGMPAGHLPVRSYLAVPVTSRMGEVIGGLFFAHSECGVFSEVKQRVIEGVAAQAAIAIDNSRLYENLKHAAEDRERLLEAERAARSEAERLNLMKDEFLATLSHELRTPLNAILGWSQLLTMGASDEAELAQGLEAIERNARTQTQLIEDLLDMSRIISGKIRLNMQWINLAHAIEQAIDTVQSSADAKHIQLHKTIELRGARVYGDPTRLQQVIWNLLTNAIKFTRPGGHVEVQLDQVGPMFHVSVSDTGIGLKPEFLASAFDRFRQADASTTRSHGGLGLGLSIVKNLVELHGGTVEAQSEGEGHGATFIVKLPVGSLRSGKGGASAASPNGRLNGTGDIGLAGAAVLLIDDEPDARQMLQRVLAQCEADVETAGSAEEAFAALRLRMPDVIVSDIGMPDVDGYEFIRRLRRKSMEEGGGVPAIALTAFARSEDRERAISAGYQVHLTKPIKPHELIATIASVLEKVT